MTGFLHDQGYRNTFTLCLFMDSYRILLRSDAVLQKEMRRKWKGISCENEHLSTAFPKYVIAQVSFLVNECFTDCTGQSL